MHLGAWAGAALVVPEVPKLIVDMGRAQLALPAPLTVGVYPPAEGAARIVEWLDNPIISHRAAFEVMGFDPADAEPDFSAVTVRMQQYGSWVKVSDLTRRVLPMPLMRERSFEFPALPLRMRRLDPMTVYPSLTSSRVRARGRG